jgi:hypothetical protein
MNFIFEFRSSSFLLGADVPNYWLSIFPECLILNVHICFSISHMHHVYG